MTRFFDRSRSAAAMRAKRRVAALRRLAPLLLPLAALVAALPGAAQQYKVIGSDGKVTYTDRAPTEGRVIPLGSRGGAPAADADLPFELRQVAGRYPVTLYVVAGACEPCDSGRTLLRQRGIPFAEKTLATAEDSEALERLAGSREAPTLTIGSQVVRGLTATLWNSYLDAAGYPRDSKLPSSYQYRPATPLVERREATAAPARAEPASPAPRAPVSSGGIQF